MPKPRLPQAKAEVSGSVLHDAGRFKGRTTPKRTRPVGAPYATMTDAQRAVWNECVAEMPWLHSAHRLLLRQVCMLAARMETDSDMGVNAIAALGTALSKLGATPTDETKVNHGEDPDDEDEFFPSGRSH